MQSIDEIISLQLDSKIGKKITEAAPAIAKAVAEELRSMQKAGTSTSEDGNQLLTETETAAMCGMSKAWLALGRSACREKYEENKGRKYVPRPPHIKIGGRVRYPLSGVLEWKRTQAHIENQDE